MFAAIVHHNTDTAKVVAVLGIIAAVIVAAIAALDRAWPTIVLAAAVVLVAVGVLSLA